MSSDRPVKHQLILLVAVLYVYQGSAMASKSAVVATQNRTAAQVKHRAALRYSLASAAGRNVHHALQEQQVQTGNAAAQRSRYGARPKSVAVLSGGVAATQKPAEDKSVSAKIRGAAAAVAAPGKLMHRVKNWSFQRRKLRQDLEFSVNLPAELLEKPAMENVVARHDSVAPPLWYNATKCPAWVTEYVTFHKKAKYLPSAQFLVFKCFDGECPFGLGDRMRALEFMFRLAFTLKRVLLIDIPRPAPLETFFIPATFDWTMMGITLPPLNQTYEVFTDDVLTNGTLNDIQQRFIVAHGTNLNHCSPVKGGPDMEWAGLLPHCIFRAMFKPSPKIQKAMDSMLQEMGIQPNQPFTALHVRIGGSIGEGRIHRNDELAALHHSIRCGRELAVSRKLVEQPLVLITDNIEVKKMILEGAFASNIRTTSQMPIYFGTAGKAAAMFESTVAEMGVLAQSTCLIAGFGGGFGLQARLWGEQTLWAVDGTGCYTPTEACIKEGIAQYNMAR